MAFDDSTISDVQVNPADAEVVISWHSTAPAGSVFQVYADGEHVWSGTDVLAHLPRPPGTTRYQVGVVAAAERGTNFSGSLPVPPGGGSRVTLTWQGGKFLSDSIAGYRVYMGTVPGGSVNYAMPVGTVPAYTQGAVTAGYGLGGYGAGGYGNASASYSWTSWLLRPGTWNAAVVPYDRMGNSGSPMTTSQVIAGPPGPIPRGAGGRRVAYALNRSSSGGYGSAGYGAGGYGSGPGSVYATLSWSASPGL